MRDPKAEPRKGDVWFRPNSFYDAVRLTVEDFREGRVYWTTKPNALPDASPESWNGNMDTWRAATEQYNFQSANSDHYAQVNDRELLIRALETRIAVLEHDNRVLEQREMAAIRKGREEA